MKTLLTILLTLFTAISIAMAQPAMMTKGYEEVDTLCQNRLSVEIVSVSGNNLDHPTHPATGIACPFFDAFTTSQTYSWYSWESSFFEHENSNTVVADVYYSGYIKVTVGDNYGHTGTDSIWFNVRNHDVPPMEDFIMEIDDDLHANFHGIAAQEHHKLTIWRGHEPGQFNYRKDFYLSPGEWIYKDNVSYSEDSLWMYEIGIFDACGSSTGSLIPGLLLGTAKNEHEEWLLTIKTIIQKDDGSFYGDKNFRYFIYTIDEYGERHIFENNGNSVVLQPEVTAWQIPGPHIDPYYQCGVGRQLDDGSYVLLSLSNKVPNPWPDTDGIVQNDDSSFSVYPNPTNGTFTVEGTGQMTITNVLGQTVLAREIDGMENVELPRGVYFVKLNGQTRKIVVE
ncbi:MAG: T9SS type A sorting domain-containing protein [Bacteroidales bacterium]|nr:T9SS type A sorting domain-containing protein [Bacteroidales bacterium]